MHVRGDHRTRGLQPPPRALPFNPRAEFPLQSLSLSSGRPRSWGNCFWVSLPLVQPSAFQTISSHLPKKVKANTRSSPMASACSRGNTAEGGSSARRAAGVLPRRPFWRGGEKKANVRRGERGPAFSCRSHGSGGWEGREEKNHAATFFCSPALQGLPAARRPRPRAQRRELESLAGEGPRPVPLLMRALSLRRGGRPHAAGRGCGAGCGRGPPSRAAFVSRPSLRWLQCGGFCGTPPGAAAARGAGGGSLR